MKKRKHGMCKTAEYRIWANAKKRCNNPNCKQYKHYGGRGIKMAPDWERNFLAFYEHVGPRPEGCELDRIDNDRGYEPGNVRWTTKTINLRNRRNTVHVTYKGRSVLVGEYAKEAGISYGTAWGRIKNRPNRLEGPQERRRGEDHHKAKLTNSQADEIRRSNELTKVLSQRYGVSVSLIRQIRRGTVRSAALGVEFSANPNEGH